MEAKDISKTIKAAKHLLATDPDVDANCLIASVADLTGLGKEQVYNRMMIEKPKSVTLQTEKEKEKLLSNMVDIVASVIYEEDEKVIPTAAVAVVQHGNKWLLGRSTACDGRCDKWTFPGGHIKNGEDPKDAACREAQEEMGIRCTPIKEISRDTNGDVVFILCKAVGGKIKCNSEFADAQFFDKNELKTLDTYDSIGILNSL